MGNLRDAILTFSKAQFSSWVASAVDFAVTILLAEIIGVWYAYATFIGAICGGITNCCINYRWVFHAFGMKKKYIAVRYMIVWGGSILLNTYGTYFLTELSGSNFIISKVVVAVLVGLFWNYQMQCRFVFSERNIKSNQYKL